MFDPDLHLGTPLFVDPYLPREEGTGSQWVDAHDGRTVRPGW